MASRIKGITVEIGGDTTGLEKALKNVNTHDFCGHNHSHVFIWENSREAAIKNGSP